MRPLKVLADAVQDKPMNSEERLDKLQNDTDRKLSQFEDALGVFKNLVVKFHDENQKLKTENVCLKDSVMKAASGAKEAVIKPLKSVGEEFVELLVEDGGRKTEDAQKKAEKTVHGGFDTGEMERTIVWMRQKFGLPSKVKEIESPARSRKKKKKK